MKKQTKTLIASIAMVLAFTACTKDENNTKPSSDTPDEDVVEEIDWENPQTGQVASIYVDNVKFDMVYVKKGSYKQLVPYYHNAGLGRVLDSVVYRDRIIEEDFLIGRYEVTQRQWLSVCTYNPSEVKGHDLPVTNINLSQMTRFVDTLNMKTGEEFRIPTTWEWQYAAIGGKKSLHFLYAGSNYIGEVAWYAGNSGGTVHPVGQLRCNELGLYDMCGNVSEHTAFGCGTIRGGSFDTELTEQVSYSNDLKVKEWYDNHPTNVPLVQGKALGFRLVMAPSQAYHKAKHEKRKK